MRLLVLNPNTSESMTAEIAAAARAVAADGVAGAAALAQALVGLGLSTSKAGVLAKGPDNPRSHWPLSASLGLDP